MVLLFMPGEELTEVSTSDCYSYNVLTNFAGLIVDAIRLTFIMAFMNVYKVRPSSIAATRPGN